MWLLPSTQAELPLREALVPDSWYNILGGASSRQTRFEKAIVLLACHSISRSTSTTRCCCSPLSSGKIGKLSTSVQRRSVIGRDPAP